MKKFQPAGASIADTNVECGLPPSAGDINCAATDHKARRIRSRSLVSYLLRVRSGVSVALYVLRKRRELKRSLPQLSVLSDRMLEDIGFTRSDIIAAEHGYLDKAQLELQRTRNRENKRVKQRNITRVSAHRSQRNAANDPDYSKTRCA